MTFRCRRCGEEHTGVPTFGFSYPIDYFDVPASERARRTFLTEDTCVVDDRRFFVRGCLEIPVHDSDEPFVWGVWVRVGKRDFFRFQDLLGEAVRAQHGPFRGRLASPPRPYPDSEGLAVRVRLRDQRQRPRIEMAAGRHPLIAEQRRGISMDRLIEIFELMTHSSASGG
jgi:hypothetical protein